MLVIDCPTHGRPILVSDRRIRSLRNTATGIQLEVECWCGTHVTLRTGRSADARHGSNLYPNPRTVTM